MAPTYFNQCSFPLPPPALFRGSLCSSVSFAVKQSAQSRIPLLRDSSIATQVPWSSASPSSVAIGLRIIAFRVINPLDRLQPRMLSPRAGNSIFARFSAHWKSLDCILDRRNKPPLHDPFFVAHGVLLVGNGRDDHVCKEFFAVQEWPQILQWSRYHAAVRMLHG